METSLQQVLMAFRKAEMIAWMEAHPEKFDQVIELALGDRQPLSWRAAWLLWSCLQENDPRMHRHLPALVAAVEGKRDGHQRELVKVLLLMELDEGLEGRVFDLCMTLWERIHAAPSVRYTALKMVLRIAGKYPDLQNDLRFFLQEHYLETLSPGIRHAVRRMVKESGTDFA
jgi:hypothetical protein